MPHCFMLIRTAARSRGSRRVLRYYLALHPAVFVGPAPWSSCRSGEAPAAGTKTARRLPCKDTAAPAGADKHVEAGLQCLQ